MRAATLTSACLSILILSGCEQTSLSVVNGSRPVASVLSESKPVQLAHKGIVALEKGDAKGALVHFNRALGLDTTNSGINLLAGMAYHLQAVQGDESKFELAREGYKLAIKFDPSNWVAQYQLGLLHMDQRNYALAQGRFAEALLFRNKDPDLLYNMTAASYYARDPETALAVFSGLEAIEPESSRVLYAAPIIRAAVNHVGASEIGLERIEDVERNANRLTLVTQRVADWRRFHAQMAQTGTQELAQAFENGDEVPVEEEIDPDNLMAMVDVTIIRTEENYTTSSGVNLLSGLQLRFGDDGAVSGTPVSAISYSRTLDPSATPTNKKTLTSLIGIPAITFSLNIANANDSRSEVLARPTLTAKNGEESSFFSGVVVNAAEVPAAGGSSGDAYQVQDKEVGVTLRITPTFLDGGRVGIAVEAERTFLKTPNTAYTGFTAKLEISKTTVQSNVVMKFGETLILSGLSEREAENNRDGVPLLQDIPLVQYLFSNKTTQDFTRSVLILITPREPGEIYDDGTADGNGRGAAMEAFRSRFDDWFRPTPNIASAIHHLKGNSLYREFRTGDIAMEHWSTRQGVSGRLRGALDFLYY